MTIDVIFVKYFFEYNQNLIAFNAYISNATVLLEPRTGRAEIRLRQRTVTDSGKFTENRKRRYHNNTEVGALIWP